MTTPLIAWAQRWQLPAPCLTDLLATLGAGVPAPPPPTPGPERSEAGIQSERVLRAARLGGILWRNNSGALPDARGVPVRFGLGNISPEVNKVMKSSDLIGITPVTCRCGQMYGVFTAEEIKAPDWKYRETDDRSRAQFNYIKKVISLGGIARFVNDPEA